MECCVPDSRLFLMPSKSCSIHPMALHPCDCCQRNLERTECGVEDGRVCCRVERDTL